MYSELLLPRVKEKKIIRENLWQLQYIHRELTIIICIAYGDSWAWGNSKRLWCYYSLTLNIYYIYKFINVNLYLWFTEFSVLMGYVLSDQVIDWCKKSMKIQESMGQL